MKKLTKVAITCFSVSIFWMQSINIFAQDGASDIQVLPENGEIKEIQEVTEEKAAPVALTGSIKDRRPIQIQLATILYGHGLAGGYYLNDNWFAGLETYSLSGNSSVDSVDIETKMTTNRLVGHYYLTDFYNINLQAGLVNRAWAFTTKNKGYVGSELVKRDITIEVEFPSSALSIGIGWLCAADYGLSASIGAGYILGGDPTVTVTAPGAPANELAKEQTSAEDDFSKYKMLPHLSMGLGWNF